MSRDRWSWISHKLRKHKTYTPASEMYGQRTLSGDEAEAVEQRQWVAGFTRPLEGRGDGPR